MREESPIRVFLVAPALLRWGLERLLSTAAPQIELSGSACSLLDAADEIESQYPDLVVALASDGETQPEGVAQTWVDTRQSPGSFVRAILDTAGGRPWQQHALNEAPVPHAERASEPGANTHASAADTLTPKQRKVVETIAAHPSAPGKVLADLLHMSEHTLRNHLTEIYAKLGVTGRNHLQAMLTEQPRRMSA
jgi:two-component system, NarL family, nitrate/nitrite response regulator NarL